MDGNIAVLSISVTIIFHRFGVLPRPNGRDRLFFPFNRNCDGNEATSEGCMERSATCPRSTVVRASIAISCGGQNTSEVNWKFTSKLLAKIVI